MVAVAQVNVVVADLERSRDFYERIGLTFQRRSRLDVEPVEAWVCTGPGITLVLHSPGFASWWDASNPGPEAGGPQIDLELDSVAELEGLVADFRARGVPVVKPPTDMTWGQRFAIIIDPDGHRIGLKAPLADE